MNEDLLAQLDMWHEEDEFQDIVDAIVEIPEADRDYVLVSHLGRALNNLGNYQEGLEQFITIAEEGKDDPLWHYRTGLSYYYLEQYEEALSEFEIADQLDPEDEDTLEFLKWCRRKITKKKPAPITKTTSKIDLSNFWNDSEDALEQYVSEPPTEDLIASVEMELVFKLPTFYKQMMKIHNGGIPHQTYYPITGDNAEANSFIAISGIYGIGRDKERSLCGDLGSRYRIEEGGYPEIGVVICDCPSPYEVVMLDYRSSGNDGEPQVIHIDQENDYKVTKLAPNFEAFIGGLVNMN